MRNSFSAGDALVWLVLTSSPIVAREREGAVQLAPEQTDSAAKQKEAEH